MEKKEFINLCKKALDLVLIEGHSRFYAAYVVTSSPADCSKVLAFLEGDS